MSFAYSSYICVLSGGMMSTPSIHIVRRYGQVGGMERYVWSLTHALARLEQPVTVLCEHAYDHSVAAISVIELGTITSKPRWLSMLRFSARVGRQLGSLDTEHSIVHSHERTAVHEVTTFHGPSILSRRQSRLDLLSPRLQIWQYLEQRELTGARVRAVLPNSDLVAAQLKQYYLQVADRIRTPAYPGVDPEFTALEPAHRGTTIGFLGHEWKRKGLPFAIDVVSALRQSDPAIEFIVAGPPPDEVRSLFSSWSGGYRLEGWSDPLEFMRRIDLLIHPARNEPFGMVIAEANAAGLPVVISNRCGIAKLLSTDQGSVLRLVDKGEWIAACRDWLGRRRAVKPLQLSWNSMALRHRDLYADLAQQKKFAASQQ